MDSHRVSLITKLCALPVQNDIRRMKFLKSLTIRKTAFLGAIPQAIADLRNLKNL